MHTYGTKIRYTFAHILYVCIYMYISPGQIQIHYQRSGIKLKLAGRENLWRTHSHSVYDRRFL